MDGSSAKKSTSLETLVIQNITNLNDLKIKLNEIIKIGKDYEYDVSSCLKTLIQSSDQDIVILTIQAISELVKCDTKRESYAQKDIIEPIVKILQSEAKSNKIELIKQCCRALGNLCCDCDTSRKIILECNGVHALKNIIERSLENNEAPLNGIKMLTCKALLNFAIGGQDFSEKIVQEDIIELLHRILILELNKEDMSDEMVSTSLLILSVISDNNPEIQFDEKVNKAVLSVLRETTNVEISELCLEHLHNQAEHDAVKTLIANEGGLQLVCSRLEQLMSKCDEGHVNTEDSDVEAIVKQACDLIIIVLTGDEAMHTLYNNGVGEIYLTMVKWLNSTKYHLLITAVLAIGNFARQDDYCTQMMDNKIFDQLLDIFQIYHGFTLLMKKEPTAQYPIEPVTVTKIQHAVLSALRNLTVPVANKRIAAAEGRAAPLLLAALPHVEDHHVAYKLLAAIRMLVDGQVEVAIQLASNPEALAGVARWGQAGECAGAAGEAPRLLAWATRLLHQTTLARQLMKVDGCISSLVNMLVVCHSVMQNEAILALCLLAVEAIHEPPPDDEKDFDCEKSFISQLVKSEIGKHVSVLIDTNCAKMPMEVAENLLTFLDISLKKKELAQDYKRAKVHESLKKFSESRKDLSDELKFQIAGVMNAISSTDLRGPFPSWLTRS